MPNVPEQTIKEIIKVLLSQYLTNLATVQLATDAFIDQNAAVAQLEERFSELVRINNELENRLSTIEDVVAFDDEVVEAVRLLASKVGLTTEDVTTTEAPVTETTSLPFDELVVDELLDEEDEDYDYNEEDYDYDEEDEYDDEDEYDEEEDGYEVDEEDTADIGFLQTNASSDNAESLDLSGAVKNPAIVETFFPAANDLQMNTYIFARYSNLDYHFELGGSRYKYLAQSGSSVAPVRVS